MGTDKQIYVYAAWAGPEPRLMGTLFVDGSKADESCSFEYDMDWLSREGNGCQLDPNLELYSGRQFAPADKGIFGIFSDSCPDRWGRLLMRRREQILARAEGRRARTLTESDFLLGVHDEARMGALRFKQEPDGDFLSCDSDMVAPPWTTLRELEAAARGFERDENDLGEKWLRQLLAPGSSLGGARPKASVRDERGNLWIAKFPSKHDETDVGLWEMVCHQLAERSGISVPESRLQAFSPYGSTYLSRRFDRDGPQRIHFASAMTMLGKKDGADDAGYLDLVDFITAHGASPKEDLHELWRRIVFSMAVSNTDDHLRNHGFIMTRRGWRLSPAYDVNPSPEGENLSLTVNGTDSLIDLGLAMEVAPYFEMSAEEAGRYIESTTAMVRESWEPLARRYGASSGSIARMRPAFMACQ